MIGKKTLRLGLPINVWFVEEPDFVDAEEESKPQGYEVSVELDGELRIGFRSVSDFQEFMTLPSKLQDVIKDLCFPGKTPWQEFLICEISRTTRFHTRVLKDKFDDILRVRVTVKGGIVNLVCEQPSYAVNALRKYFPL